MDLFIYFDIYLFILENMRKVGHRDSTIIGRESENKYKKQQRFTESATEK